VALSPSEYVQDAGLNAAEAAKFWADLSNQITANTKSLKEYNRILKEQSAAAAEAIKKAQADMAAAAKEAAIRLQQAQSAVVSFSNAISGFIRAGLQGTAEGNRLSYAWMLLTKQIASIFLPVIERMTAGIQRLTSYLGGMDGVGQRVALVFSGIAMALGTLIVNSGILTGAWLILKDAMSLQNLGIFALVTALTEFLTGTKEGHAILYAFSEIMNAFGSVMSVVGQVITVVIDALVVAFQAIYRTFAWVAIKIAGLIEAILDWIPGLGDATASVRAWKENAQKNLDDMMASGWGVQKAAAPEKKQVGMANGQFEGLGASFQRVTEAANKMSGGPEAERHNAAMAKQDKLIEKVGDVAKAVEKQAPALAR